MNVYTIVVLTSGDRYKTDVIINDFRPRKLDDSFIEETAHKIIYLCPKYVTDKTPEPYRDWLLAINDSLDKQVDETDYDNAIIQEIFSLIKTDGISPKDRAKMIDEYSDEEYMLDERRKSKKEGKAEGKAEGIKESAKAMINKGLDFMLISEITGLSESELRAL
jgi:predicted transposase/invertase (TIGR01784 family)